jgi:hypothetical protein
MHNTTPRTVIDVVTDFLAREPSPQEIIDYILPEDIQARADYLAERNGAGLLSFAEEEEFGEFVNVDELFSLLKTKMRLKLKHQTSQSE